MTDMSKRWPGLFISFEGGDGVGKSTQLARFVAALKNHGNDVVTTREPGGSAGAEDIRQLLVTGPPDRWSALTESLLMNAARADHLEKTILPALHHGRVVVTDRFADSTRAYQGAAGHLPMTSVLALEQMVVGTNTPDVTIVLSLKSEQALERARDRLQLNGENTSEFSRKDNENSSDVAPETRFEDKGQTYQAAVHQAFTDIALSAPERCILIDAQGSIEDVADRIWQAFSERFPDRCAPLAIPDTSL